MHNILIAGAGGIGRAAGLILAEHFQSQAHITFGDINQDNIDSAISFVQDGCMSTCNISGALMPRSGENQEIRSILQSHHIILDCLPGSQAPRMAKWCLDHQMHYANLTEYVAETEQIIEMAKGANTGFVLQTGLAPGFINVLACKVFEDFVAVSGIDKADKMTMKVGALSQHAQAPHYYAFTWSPIGVATEYVKDADAVRDYQKIKVPALSNPELILIDGEAYEDNYTSGGAADLPDYYQGRIRDLDYKTLRYQGHYSWVKDFLGDKEKNQATIDALEAEMLAQIPMVEDDVVVVYASVKGKDIYGKLRQTEKSYKIYPSKIGNQMLRAIQTTTAGPLCQMALDLLEGKYRGVVLQSDVDTDSFLNGSIVKSIYGAY